MTSVAPVFAAWDIGSFLQNIQSVAKEWGGYVIVIFGIIAVIAAAVMTVKGLLTHGKSQTNWVIIVLMLIVGGALMVGGFSFVADIAEGGKKTIEDLGGGTIDFGGLMTGVCAYLG